MKSQKLIYGNIYDPIFILIFTGTNLNSSSMNYIDIILGIILIISAISGFRKGFVVELASLAALILGIWGAIKFSYITSDFLTETFNWSSKHMGVVSFIITFVVIVILVHMVGKAVDNLIKVAQLGFVNRLAGLVFGFIKSALILSIVLFAFDSINDSIGILSKETKENSLSYEPVVRLAPAIFPFVKIWTEENILEKKDGDNLGKEV